MNNYFIKSNRTFLLGFYFYNMFSFIKEKITDTEDG